MYGKSGDSQDCVKMESTPQKERWVAEKALGLEQRAELKEMNLTWGENEHLVNALLK